MFGISEFTLLIAFAFGACSIVLLWSGKQLYGAVCGIELSEENKTRLYEGATIVASFINGLLGVFAALAVCAVGLLILASFVNEGRGLSAELATFIAKYWLVDTLLAVCIYWVLTGPFKSMASDIRYRPKSYEDNKKVLAMVRFITALLGMGCAVMTQRLFSFSMS